jgi:glycosyltransferase involved in cell wall biosynthesis
MALTTCIVFWQGFCSPHQSDLLAAIAKTGREVIWCVDSIGDRSRQSQGWTFQTPPGVNVVESPSDAEILRQVRRNPATTLHICSFTRNSRVTQLAVASILKHSGRLAIFSEYFDGRGIAGLFRRIRGTILSVKIGRRVELILAIGPHAVEWFSRCGFPRRRIKEFGYFVSTPTPSDDQILENTMIYAGRLDSGKGVPLLIRALPFMMHESPLEIVGDGPERSNVEDLVRRKSLGQRVKFAGSLPRIHAMARIGASGLLVLPSSSKDGWGVVVNEALLQGTSVVVSNRCGASCLARKAPYGLTFKSGDVRGLADCLDRVVSARLETHGVRARVAGWGKDILSPVVGARYLCELIDGATVEPPWWH